ncbi:MAG: nitronate monooxygenase, partial [Nocardioidaceae bacterium]
AVGAWVGTAFLAAREAGHGAAARRRLLAAGEADTAYDRVFDVALALGWPAEFGGRTLRNDYLDRWRGRLAELAGDQEASAELVRAMRVDDFDVACLYAGQGVGLLDRERPAAEVLADLGRAEDLLRRF